MTGLSFTRKTVTKITMNKKNKNVDMLNGSITKGILAMSIPIMIMNVMQMLFNIIDMSSLKWFGKESAVGAVGTCGTLTTICTSLLVGLSAGANVVIARHLGTKEQKKANDATSTSLIIALAGGILLALLGAIFAEPLVGLTKCPDSLMPDAVSYFRTYFYGVPVIMIYNFCAAILRALGDAKKPMRFLITAGIIKTCMCIVLVGLFDMSVEGVALATIIAYTVIAILGLRAVLGYKDIIQVDLKKLAFDFGEFKDIIHMGVPAGLQSALYSVANLTIVATVNSFGEAATKGLSIANQFDAVLYHVSYAPSLAVIPFVAQNMGAKNYDRVKKIIKTSIIIVVAFGATIGALSAIFSGQLSSLMTSDPAAIRYSQQKMMLVSSTYFICGINEIMGGVHKGMGKPMLPTIATLIFMCLIRFPWVWFVFPLFSGPNTLTYLYLIWPIGWILSITTLVIGYFPTMKKIKRGI